MSNLLEPKDQNRFADTNTTTVTTPERVDDLRAGGPTQSSVELVWTTPANESATAISDYKVYFRRKGTVPWIEVSDGVSTDTYATVSSGLSAGTTYQFRVYASNGNLSIGSNIAELATLPQFSDIASLVYDDGFSFVNTGGATSSRVVALEDSTTITLNGAVLQTLNKGQTHAFVSARWDVLDADAQVYVTGASGAANIPWAPVGWAGKSFATNATRQADTQIYVYALQDAAIVVLQGSTQLGVASLAAGEFETFTISDLGSYQISSSTGYIVASMINASDNDPKAIPPASYALIGFPSQSATFSTFVDFNDYEYIHSGGTSVSGTFDASTDFQITAMGTATLYQSQSVLVSGSKPMGGASYDDGNGNDSAPFLPTSYMKKKYVLNVNANYVRVASTFPATIQAYDTAGNASGSAVTLSRTGSGDSPYYGSLGAQTKGFSFVSDYPVAIWYQPDGTDAESVASDVTIMFGSN